MVSVQTVFYNLSLFKRFVEKHDNCLCKSCCWCYLETVGIIDTPSSSYAEIRSTGFLETQSSHKDVNMITTESVLYLWKHYFRKMKTLERNIVKNIPRIFNCIVYFCYLNENKDTKFKRTTFRIIFNLSLSFKCIELQYFLSPS